MDDRNYSTPRGLKLSSLLNRTHCFLWISVLNKMHYALYELIAKTLKDVWKNLKSNREHLRRCYCTSRTTASQQRSSSLHMFFLSFLVGRLFFSVSNLTVSCNSGYPIHKPGLVEDICIVEHSILQGHHNKLGVSEMSLKHLPNILGMREIKGCIHFIQDVNWGRPEEEHG